MDWTTKLSIHERPGMDSGTTSLVVIDVDRGEEEVFEEAIIED